MKIYKMNKWFGLLNLIVLSIIAHSLDSPNFRIISVIYIFTMPKLYNLFMNEDFKINKYHEIIELITNIYLVIVFLRYFFDSMLNLIMGYDYRLQYLQERLMIILLLLFIMNIYRFFAKEQYVEVSINKLETNKLNYYIFFCTLILSVIYLYFQKINGIGLNALIVFVNLVLLINIKDKSKNNGSQLIVLAVLMLLNTSYLSLLFIYIVYFNNKKINEVDVNLLQ